ncbi:peroxiredoxin [Pedobacter sp. UYP30]|uniref:peroxiredoxin family protein n=1 Tax=Pedobacter sp. UYP30 TaxID=1756400 RepID=UPI0033985112
MSTIEEVQSYKQQKDELNKQVATSLPPEIKAVFDHDAENLGRTYPNPLKVDAGDKAPLFTLPNALGNEISLENLLKTGKVVMVFYHGEWCPFCNLVLKTYQNILPQIKAKRANLIAISGQLPNNSLNTKEKNNLEFEVLSDAHQMVAKQYTTVFKNGEKELATMKELGMDFNSFYSDQSGEIPVPAVFIIDENGMISYAGSGGGDYRERIEPEEILKALD